jgi:hypothetical protein
MENGESAFAVRVFRIGVCITAGVAAASLAYLLATPDGANRGWLLLITAAVAAGAVLVHRLPQQRIIESGRAPLVWGVWNVVHVLGITVAVVLDGGDTPYAGLYWVAVAFGAITLPVRFVVALTALAIAGLALVGVVHADGDVALWPMALRAVALVATAGVCAAIASDRRHQVATLERSNEEIVRRLALVVEHRDHDTGGHVERIGSYTAILADELGETAAACEQLRLASILHDVGKVGIPDEILLKPGPLTPDERRVMERHAQIGHDMLTGSDICVLDVAADIALTHHERFDGTGYPHGLSGGDIPLGGRLVAVADVFDALTSHRVYKAAMDLESAVAVICDGAGTHFDPEVVAAFVRRLDDVRATYADLQPAAHATPRAPLAVA